MFVYTRAKPVISLLCFRVICLMACTSLLKVVRQTQHILQQKRQNILKIARQPQSLVLMQCSSYLRLAVKQAHRICRLVGGNCPPRAPMGPEPLCLSGERAEGAQRADCGEHTGGLCWKYALEAIIKALLLYFLVHDNCLYSCYNCVIRKS